MYKLIVFDMDGTLADTSRGIFDSYNEVSKKLKGVTISDEDLRDVIGGSLPKNLERKLSLDGNEVKGAVKIYRDYYSDEGFKRSRLYDGVKDTVIDLYNRGYILSIATLKAERFAIKLVDIWGLSNYFTSIVGVDENDTVTKPEMIRRCMDACDCGINEAVMVGDSPSDLNAAKDCNIDFIAVTYGYQFTVTDCIDRGLRYIDHFNELSKVL